MAPNINRVLSTVPGYGSRGASMGRPAGRYVEDKAPSRVYLQRVTIDRYGYDAGGAYWGIGAPLWCAWTDEPDRYGATFKVYRRGADRASVVEMLRNEYPGITFRRGA